MGFHRRKALQLMAAGVGTFVLPRLAAASDYPDRPIRLVVGYPPGGPADIMARLVGQWLSERLGQPIVIENKAGAASNVAAEAVVHARPDGYTLFLVNVANAINATLYPNLSYNFIRDIAPIAGIARVPNVMETPPNFPAKTTAEFISYAKANPGKVSFASGGVGTSLHMSGELFKMMTGIDMLHVPYRGSAPALTDLMAGRVQVMFDSMPSSISYIKAGRISAIAVTTAQRSPALPNVPTVRETVPGYQVSGWFGLGAPAKTPLRVIDRLNKETNSVLGSPKNQARLRELGAMTLSFTSDEFGKFVSAETEEWAKVVKFSGAKPS